MITVYAITILAAIVMQAFFTASEMAITSISKIKLKNLVEEGEPHALKLTGFLEQEGSFLGTTLMGTNLAVVISSVLATRIFTEYFGPRLSPVLATAVMVPITLVFAEIIPKMIAREFSLPVALKTVTPLTGFFRIFYPLIIAVNSIAGSILAPFGKGKTAWDLTFTKHDLKSILHLGRETGEVEEDEVELIHRILDFETKTVDRIMVPLYRVSSISVDESIDSLKKLVSLTGFSRIPAYAGNKNTLEGVVNIYDVLFAMEGDEKKVLVKDFIREPVYVNKKDGLDIALARLRHRKQPMGIVVDEDNKVVGIVTIEDMLEEIVGEI